VSTILHIGVGAFHRAHQAAYVQRLRQLGERRWRLVGGNIRNDAEPAMRALAAAGCRYTLETISPAGEHRYERIESIDEVIPWSADLGQLISVGARADTRIISFTVTEGGYYLGAAGLDSGAPEIERDLTQARAARPGSTIYGALYAILKARRERGAGAITLLSCDNLRHNGERFRVGLLRFLELVGDAELAAWTGANAMCPNCMVDRITPRPDQAVRERVKLATGRDDPSALMSESFSQWVIEKNFAASRPDWEAVGVQMVDSVIPYEEAKIRILNGSHSCLAWAGALTGRKYIHDAVQDPRLQRLAMDYVADVIPCLIARGRHPVLDLPKYRDEVLLRFSNVHLRDSVQRVAQDSFAKFIGFVAPTILERLSLGAGLDGVSIMPALLLRYLQRWNRSELPFLHVDQTMDETAVRAICAAADPVAALCQNVALFGAAGAQPSLISAVRAAVARVDRL
jgi:D-arabinitol 4-dehydrogenase